MKTLKANKYEAVIVGAGIGGLVCGCYLAKAGVKVLIVEKGDKPGGCCTSFKRNGYKFDVAVHYLGSCREGGKLNIILRDLSLEERLEFKRIDPADTIIMPDHKVLIHADYKLTKESFKGEFYAERDNIEKFFAFVCQSSIYEIYKRTFDCSFLDLLNEFFSDKKLKATISVLLGNVGLPASMTPALSASILFREYICDPGYYPVGGIQAFPDLLAKRFSEYKGELLLGEEVKSIDCKNGRVTGVRLGSGVFVEADNVVSNADATRTFNKMLVSVGKVMDLKFKKLKPSVSPFVCYLGVSAENNNMIGAGSTTWRFKTYEVDRCYKNPIDPRISSDLEYLIITLPSKVSEVGRGGVLSAGGARMIVGVKACDNQIWEEQKHEFSQRLISGLSEFMPEVAQNIEFIITATPYDFVRYTYNRDGAMYGWAAIKEQLKKEICPQKTHIENLFLAGHWSTNGFGQSGIPGVALSGKDAAKLVLESKNSLKGL